MHKGEGLNLDPWFRFSRLLLKRVKIFPLYRLRIFWWKQNIGRAIFTLISINGQYCAMSQNLFCPPFLNGIFFFFIFYFKNENFFMFFNFEPNFIEKFLWKSGFSNFGHVTFLRNENSFFGRHFETKHFLIVLFADIWLFWVHTHMVQVSYRNF